MKPYSVEFAPEAIRALESGLPEKISVAIIEFVYGALAANPKRVGKPLRPPLTPLWSARRGEYRVVYDIQEDRVVVRVVSVSHRRDAYR